MELFGVAVKAASRCRRLEWPGSGVKSPSETSVIRNFDLYVIGVSVLIRCPLNRSIGQAAAWAKPSMWSNERFSIISTTMCLRCSSAGLPVRAGEDSKLLVLAFFFGHDLSRIIHFGSVTAKESSAMTIGGFTVSVPGGVGQAFELGGAPFGVWFFKGCGVLTFVFSLLEQACSERVSGLKSLDSGTNGD